MIEFMEEQPYLCPVTDILHVCRHSDGETCDICCYELDAGEDFDDETIQVSRVAHA